MLLKTHLAIAILLVLIFLSSVEHKISFVLITFFAVILPDIDSGFSTIGNHKTLKPLQFFVRHRGLIHSFSFLFLITIFFALFFPILALGFFLGYGSHLFADMFTNDGIMPFYPWKRKSGGWIRTGGKTETMVFIFFVIADLIIFLLTIRNLI
mgnify:CR=1 FL=1